MKRIVQKGCVTAMLLAGVACGSDTGSYLARGDGVALQRVVPVGVGPVPYKGGTFSGKNATLEWPPPGSGSPVGRVDLLVADALAACSSGGLYPGNLATETLPQDAYFTALYKTMRAVSCGHDASLKKSDGLPPNPTSADQWIALRNNQACNRDPNTLVPTAAQIAGIGSGNVNPVYDGGATCGGGEFFGAFPGATFALQSPPVNLCVAQLLRQQAPGTSAPGTLLLSSAEQRKLLELIRERAQMAVLGYSNLFTALSTELPPQGCPQGQTGDTLTGLMFWADSHDAPSVMPLANDFAAALQLLVSATEDVAALLRRSASARADRGGPAGSVAELRWGAGSWLQRHDCTRTQPRVYAEVG